MPTVTTDEKAITYLGEGRVNVEHVDLSTAVFRVQGSAAEPYIVRYSGGFWRCNCPARKTCCHIKACAKVTPNSNPAGRTPPTGCNP